MIIVDVILFAGAKELAGQPVVRFTADFMPCVGDVRRWLASKFPQMAGLIAVSRFAYNNEYVADTHPLKEKEEKIALIPPVSGG